MGVIGPDDFFRRGPSKAEQTEMLGRAADILDQCQQRSVEAIKAVVTDPKSTPIDLAELLRSPNQVVATAATIIVNGHVRPVDFNRDGSSPDRYQWSSTGGEDPMRNWRIGLKSQFGSAITVSEPKRRVLEYIPSGPIPDPFEMNLEFRFDNYRLALCKVIETVLHDRTQGTKALDTLQTIMADISTAPQDQAHIAKMDEINRFLNPLAQMYKDAWNVLPDYLKGNSRPLDKFTSDVSSVLQTIEEQLSKAKGQKANR